MTQWIKQYLTPTGALAPDSRQLGSACAPAQSLVRAIERSACLTLGPLHSTKQQEGARARASGRGGAGRQRCLHTPKSGPGGNWEAPVRPRNVQLSARCPARSSRKAARFGRAGALRAQFHSTPRLKAWDSVASQNVVQATCPGQILIDECLIIVVAPVFINPSVNVGNRLPSLVRGVVQEYPPREHLGRGGGIVIGF
jgi:hypothetical protein